jgi:hypothetical protein
LNCASLTHSSTVKFDGAKLPPILNSLETENNGQKLVLEVAVRCLAHEEFSARIGLSVLTVSTATSW